MARATEAPHISPRPFSWSSLNPFRKEKETRRGAVRGNARRSEAKRGETRYNFGLALIISLGWLHEVVNARLKRAVVATVLRNVIIFHPANFSKFHCVFTLFRQHLANVS
ncbi:hypothetical protein G5I_12614 [Acromyrmex echinatior]|uniref:Uncharacterized protein n=1 Tax=Acromyrmex echinatior TaxID=103372 RepID=F4X2T3_ACREC|nr:hypothetical protein G5I_12614 [Acromyrmex echinatior]